MTDASPHTPHIRRFDLIATPTLTSMIEVQDDSFCIPLTSTLETVGVDFQRAQEYITAAKELALKIEPSITQEELDAAFDEQVVNGEVKEVYMELVASVLYFALAVELTPEPSDKLIMVHAELKEFLEFLRDAGGEGIELEEVDEIVTTDPVTGEPKVIKMGEAPDLYEKNQQHKQEQA